MKHLATWIEKDRGQHFEELFQQPEYRLWNARVESVPWNDIQGLLLTGGCDISIDYLKQDVPNLAHIVNPDGPRDHWEFLALKQAFQTGLPILAICRGHQVLNVALGGTLFLDIPGHALPEQKYGDLQELRHVPNATVKFERVNSSHHQAIDRLGDGLEVEAWHVGDDIIEQVRLKNYPFCLGAQYHPERGIIYKPIFDAFLEHVR